MLDAAVIGAGVIGLSTAYELGRSGAVVHLFDADRAGTASEAAAGLLAPSMGDLPDDARPFFSMSLGAYPGFVDRLRAFDHDLSIVEGLIEVVDTRLAGADAEITEGGRRISAAESQRLEPNVRAPLGALFHPADGAIDNQRLVRALRMAVDAAPSVTRRMEDVERIELGDTHATVVMKNGARVDAAAVVLAAGAWASQIQGLPRDLPVAPLKGQMLAVQSSAIRHSIVGLDVYLVPRRNEVLIGATTERAGFDITVDPASIEGLRRAAIEVCPSLADAPVLRSWAGLRPATPDMLPILGADPLARRLFYACGHSKNGILLAPATGAAIAAAVLGAQPIPELAPFSVSRFERAPTSN